MKKGLAFLLSLSLILAGPAAAYAEPDDTAAGSSAAFPISYDSRNEAVIRPQIDLTHDAWLKMAAEITDEETDGDRVVVTEAGFEASEALTAAQKTFILARRSDLSEAGWFSMNDATTSQGTPQMRIKQALLDGRVVLLGETSEIIGWDDEAVTDRSSSDDEQRADTVSEETGSDVPAGQNESAVQDEAIQNEPAVRDEAIQDEPAVQDDAIQNDPSGQDEAVQNDPPVNDTPVPEDEAVIMTAPEAGDTEESIPETAALDEEPAAVDTDPANDGSGTDPEIPVNDTEDPDDSSDQPAEAPGETDLMTPALTAPVPEVTEDSDAAGDDSGEAAEDFSCGAWLIRDLESGEVTSLSYEEPSLADKEILTLLFAPQDDVRCVYRTDGGIGDGRLITAEGRTEDQSEDQSETEPADRAEAQPGSWMAEVFTARGDESLKAVQVYTDTARTDYELQIYLKQGEDGSGQTTPFFGNDENLTADDLTAADLAAAHPTASFEQPLQGTLKGAGLHEIVLPAAITLTPGEEFAVCLRFSSDKTALFYDTTQTVYGEAGQELWTSTSKTVPGTQLISRDGEIWETPDPDTVSDLRLGAVTDGDGGEALMTAASEPVEDGAIYVIHCAGDKNYVLDVTGGAVAIRTNIQVHTANGTVAQKWFAHRNADGTWSFVSYMAGRALDVEGNSSALKTNVQLHTPRFRDSQRWKIADAGSGTWTITHADSGRVLDVAGGTLKNGANIQTYKPNQSTAQKFTFEKISDSDFSGDYLMVMPASSGSVVGVASASKDENANIEIQSKTGAAQQIFTLSKVSGSYYKVINKNSGKAMTINSRAAAGMNVKQAAYTGTDLQLWRVVFNDDGTFTLFSKALANICLDVSGGKTTTGTNVRANGYSKAAYQTFYLKDPNKGPLDGTYVVRSALYPDRVLDVANGSSDAGANIRSYNNNWTVAQQFVFKQAGTASSVYTITNKSSGRMLAYSGTLQNDANVIQDTASASDARKWYVTANSDGTYTISPYQNQNLALDIASGSIAYKTNIRVHKANASAAQKWYLSSQTISTCTLSSANKVQVTGKGGTAPGDDNKVYLFALNPVNYCLGSASPIGSASDGASFTITSSALNMEQYINREFFTGIKIDGKYHLTSNGMYITNPEKASTKSVARSKPANKKGMALSSYSSSFIDEAINTLHIKHTAMNIPLSAFITGSNASISYQGKTFTFTNMEGYKQIVRKLNAAGVQVTGIIYADAWLGTSAYADYITPTGRNAQAAGAVLAGMNASEAAGRQKLEAAFTYMAMTFSDADCHIDNWVIGNELDNPVTWNYCGSGLPIDQYVTLYTQVYRLAYNAMKRVWGNVRVYDSLDNVWNVTSRGSAYYTARNFQDSFNTILSGEGAINWGLAFHPYCAPELDPRIWAHPTYATSDGRTTPRITLDNISVLPAYVSSAYGSGHPIILSETGINYRYQGVDMPNEQAAAIAYGYYNVESANGIDNLIIHNENGGEWTLGLYNANGSKRPSFYVFANMDGKNAGPKYTTVNQYGGRTLLQIVASGKGKSGVTKWSQLISGFDMGRFQDSRY